jgi:hypothetical protein
MFCTKCGEKIPMLSKFCTKCGKKIKDEDGSKNGGKPRRFRALKILGLFAAVFAVLIAIPFTAYLIMRSQVETYKHPAVGFSVTYPKFLKVEIPTLPAEAACKAAAPCYLLFKNPSYNDYVANWVFVVSAADVGATKEDFINGMEKGTQVDIDNGEATLLTLGDKKVYKYVNDPSKPSSSVNDFYTMLQFDPSLEQSVYVFMTGDSFVLVGFRKPPPGASSEYSGYLNIKSLIAP